MEQPIIILSQVQAGNDRYILTLDKTPGCYKYQIAVSETGKSAVVLFVNGEQIAIEPLEPINIEEDFAVYQSISFVEKATKEMGSEKISPETRRSILLDLESQIAGLQYRINERVGARPGYFYKINTSAMRTLSPAEIISEIKSMGVQVVTESEEKQGIEEIDLRVNVEYVTSLLIELRKLQDQFYEFSKLPYTQSI